MADFFGAVGEALGDYRYLALYGLSMILGLILLEGRKKLFLIPSLVMTLLIFNPLLKDVWEKINEYGYWRMLWIIPVVPVCAAVPAMLFEKTRKGPVKVMTAVLSLAVFALAGSFVFQNYSTTFTQAANADKLPQSVTESAEVLLEKEEYPRVVSDSSVGTYLRQYSGRFQTPYGRDIQFGNPSQYARDMIYLLEISDLQRVAERMRSGRYRYLVTRNLDSNRQEALTTAGFELLKQVKEYGVYRLD